MNQSILQINKNAKITFILPLIFFSFPIIYLFSKNLSEEPIFILQLLSLFIIVAFSLWLLLGYALKNRIKSSLIISLWAGLFFSNGHLRFFLNDILIISNVKLALITFSIYIILFIIFPIFIIKTKRELNNIAKIVMISALVVIMMPIMDVGQFFIFDYDYFTGKNMENHLDVNSVSIPDYHPDVYYIIPDEYAGSKSLEMFWNYDNSNFTNFLIENDFYVAQDSFSNYDRTATSIPSIMNMEYTHESNTIDATGQKEDTWQVFDNFRSKGYTTYFIESGLYLDFYLNNVDNKLCSPSDIFDSFFIRNIFEYSMILPPSVEFLLQDNVRDKIICSFNELDKISENDVMPKFVLTHVMAPHSPFVFDSDGGNPESIISNLENVTAYKEQSYTNQLQFTNSKIKHIVQKLLDTDNPPIIIIQSDHGWRLSYDQDDPSTQYIKYLNNFKAYYLPNGDRNIELENTSPVNTFRILFNTYFDDNYEILENKFYVLDLAGSELIEVSDFLVDPNSNN